MNYLLAQALHLLCVESYVVMSPFYYSNYQSILFCVGTLIKFVSNNDVCVCLSIVLYLLIPHSYNPHLTTIGSFAFANYILIYLSYFTAAAPGGASTTGIKCSYPFFSSIRISPDFSLLLKLNTAEKSIRHLIRDHCLPPQH